MRNPIIILISLMLSATSCSAQNNINNSILDGVWQFSSHEVGSAYLENYQFFKEGRFIFNTNQYNELKRIISLRGSYNIDGDSLYLEVQSMIEDTGSSKITRSRTTTINDSWALTGDYIENERIIEGAEVFVVDIKTCKSTNGIPCILIDGNIYYKIIEDPNDY